MDAFPDDKRDICLGGVVLRLGKSGTDSELLGMAHNIDEQKDGTETYSDTNWPDRRLAWSEELRI